jgi:hypothetical protein
MIFEENLGNPCTVFRSFFFHGNPRGDREEKEESINRKKYSTSRQMYCTLGDENRPNFLPQKGNSCLISDVR